MPPKCVTPIKARDAHASKTRSSSPTSPGRPTRRSRETSLRCSHSTTITTASSSVPSLRTSSTPCTSSGSKWMSTSSPTSAIRSSTDAYRQISKEDEGLKRGKKAQKAQNCKVEMARCTINSKNLCIFALRGTCFPSKFSGSAVFFGRKGLTYRSSQI